MLFLPSFVGCDSQYGTIGADVQCSKPPTRDCSSWGGTYEAVRCIPPAPNSTQRDSCAADYGTCGQVHAACNASGFCVVRRGAEPGPLCRSTLPYLPLAANGKQWSKRAKSRMPFPFETRLVLVHLHTCPGHSRNKWQQVKCCHWIEMSLVCGMAGTQVVLSFDEEDPSCLDIYTNSATQYEGNTP